MKTFEINKIAVTMGKVLNLLSSIEPNISDEWSAYDSKEELCTLAYICRKGILEKIEMNSVLLSNPTITIRIPTGIFSSKKETLESGLNKTVGKLKELASRDSVVVQPMVENILKGGALFYQYDKLLSERLRYQF